MGERLAHLVLPQYANVVASEVFAAGKANVTERFQAQRGQMAGGIYL